MGQFLPISFAFIASGIAVQAKAALYNFKSAQVNSDKPAWANRGEEFPTSNLTMPIAYQTRDSDYWLGRYALTDITFETPQGEQLVINDATVSISKPKIIKKTVLVGLKGSIKEYITDGDYEIKLSVGIVAVNAKGEIVDEYPEDGLRKVREVLDINEALKVSSLFFDIHDIHKLVVTNFAEKQMTYSNRQVIEITAISDEDYEIKSTEY